MSYLPGGTLTKTKRPSLFVVVDRDSCVEASVRVTFAPGTTAPLWSVTAPVTVPVETDCPHNETGRAHSNAMATSALYSGIPAGDLLRITTLLKGVPDCDFSFQKTQ